MEKRTITISREEFTKAIQKANEQFKAIGAGKIDMDPTMEMFMSLQNLLFGQRLADVLFSSDEDENKNADEDKKDESSGYRMRGFPFNLF